MNGMSPDEAAESRRMDSTRVLELVVAAAIMLLGALVMYSNYQIGALWAEDGPQAGYFPFYVGLLMTASSAIVFIRALRASRPAKIFVTRPQFRLVIALLVPTILYVVVMAYIGIYIASALYLAYFMRTHGRYGPALIAPVALGLPALLFVVFEIWFLIPLPKGPVEMYFGY